MVYGAEAVLPCDIINDSPRVRMYEEREAELDRQDDLKGLARIRGMNTGARPSLEMMACARGTRTELQVMISGL